MAGNRANLNTLSCESHLFFCKLAPTLSFKCQIIQFFSPNLWNLFFSITIFFSSSPLFSKVLNKWLLDLILLCPPPPCLFQVPSHFGRQCSWKDKTLNDPQSFWRCLVFRAIWKLTFSFNLILLVILHLDRHVLNGESAELASWPCTCFATVSKIFDLFLSSQKQQSNHLSFHCLSRAGDNWFSCLRVISLVHFICRSTSR